MNRLLAGAIAGAVASAMHTAAMLGVRRVMRGAQHEPVPPVQVTAAFARRTGVRPRNGAALRAAAALLHFGYGAAAGALYSALHPHLPSRPAASGVGFGLLVWAASYLGWLPAAGLIRPATQEPLPRNAMMLLAHVAWGVALSGTLARLGPAAPASGQRRREREQREATLTFRRISARRRLYCGQTRIDGGGKRISTCKPSNSPGIGR
ncbi:MAG TPA: DUF6789 family protein [Burkholderiales bacterium]